MSTAPTVAAIGVVDARGVVGTGGVRADWLALGVEPLGTARSFRTLFQTADRTFRRLDGAGRALVLAAEAAGLQQVLPDSARDEVSIVVETEPGSLESDLRFARGLECGLLEGAVFPYTLPSASLGEVALRHRLRGPALCLSITEQQRGQAFEEARRLLDDGEARFALVCRADVLAAPCSRMPAALSAIVVLLARSEESSRAVAALPAGSGDPFARLARELREGGS